VKRGICKLCQLEKELQDSHLMPAAVYRRTLTPSAKNPHPVAITEKGMVHTSEQVRDFVFCKECERRFDRGGENYVMRLISTKTRFPLLEKLEGARCLTSPKGWRAYEVKDTPHADRDVIGYFAVSVFWRASVHRWKWADGRNAHIELGEKYNEAMRRYLMGELPFPKHVHLFVVGCTDWMTQDVFFMPTYNDRLGRGWQYSFGARGIAFMMQVGKDLPNYSRLVSCMTRPQRLLFTNNSEELTLQTLARFRFQHEDYKAAMRSSSE
jgi:hypothetical protein